MKVLVFLLLACSVLAANEDKIEFKQLEIDSPVEEVLYCGPKKEIMLLLTEERQAYRSESSGNSWKLIPAPSDSWKIKKIVFSKADSKLVAFLGKEGMNWYSEDCGKTLKTLNYASLMENFQFHPKMRAWGLAGSWTRCPETEDEECIESRVLYLTKDLGSTWEPILDFVIQFSWGIEGLAAEVTREFPIERIFATRSNNPSEVKTKGWNYNYDFIRSDDFFANFETLVPHGNKFLLASRYILVATAVEDDKEEVQLMVSYDQAIDVFYKAELPVKRIPEHSYTLVDASEGSIFIHVNHYGTRSDYGTIYISDAPGRRFSISLLYNARAKSSFCDFQKVRGIEGVYIANIYDKDHYLNEASTDKKAKNASKRFQKTVITFDKGGEWRPIEPPERDSVGKRIICEDSCALHLHSVTSSFSSIYTNENSIGLLIGTGNVGRYLSYKEDELNTYLSRDGGSTWAEIKKGEFVYEMGDHGAIILMADSQKATDTLYYSWNEGLTWESLSIDFPLEVEEIIIEPTATSQKFLVYGEKDGKGVVVAVDFSTFHEPMCRNPEKAGKSDSDYEIWSPRTGQKGCLMGHKIEYVRRKQEAECFNGEEFERPVFVEDCQCTEEDFECDYGFYRGDNGVCKKMETFELSPAECGDDGYIREPTGYRRVAGDTCIGGVSAQLQPKPVACSQFSGWVVYFILAAGIFIVGVYVFWYHTETIYKISMFFSRETFDRTGFFSDLSKAPEGMDEEEMVDTKKAAYEEEEEFDPRKN